MTDLFLIAHRVRSEPAFDIATQIDCAECAGQGEIGSHPDKPMFSCSECDGEGFWWIIGTSGHRAYPYWCCILEELDFLNGKHPNDYLGVMPSDWPDHYTTRASPARPSLASLLAIPRPTLKVDRRF